MSVLFGVNLLTSSVAGVAAAAVFAPQKPEPEASTMSDDKKEAIKRAKQVELARQAARAKVLAKRAEAQAAADDLRLAAVNGVHDIIPANGVAGFWQRQGTLGKVLIVGALGAVAWYGYKKLR